MKAKIQKKRAIELILSEMKEGNIDAPSILSSIGKDWQIAERTFYRYYNEAEKTHKERQQAILDKVIDKSIDVEKERTERKILTKLERLEIASKIARGEGRKVGDEVIIPSDSDRIRAMDYMSKVDGDLATKKIDLTTKGEQIGTKIDFSKLDDETLEKIVTALQCNSE